MINKKKQAITTSIRLYDDERKFVEQLAKRTNTNFSGAIRMLVNLERAKGEMVIHVLTSLYSNNYHIAKHGFKHFTDNVIRPINQNHDVQTITASAKTFHVGSNIQSVERLIMFIEHEIGKLVVNYLMKGTLVSGYTDNEYACDSPLTDEMIVYIITSLNQNSELLSVELKYNQIKPLEKSQSITNVEKITV